MIPNQGIGGYPMMNNFPADNGKAVRLKNGIRIIFKIEFSENGTNGARLCKQIIDIPMKPTFFVGDFNKKLNIINPNPVLAITSNNIV
jgi:hypothetical protein